MNKMKNKYILVGLLFIVLFFATGCGASTSNIEYNGEQIDAYMPIIKSFTGIMDILVIPMAALMYFLGKTVAFGNYAIVILLATIIVRSIAWPIYGKTNDMSMKMSLLAPEQAKIEKRYEGRTDTESQQRKSMEMMQLYKKYKVSFTGCFMPFIQMPIFLAFFETLRRIPSSIATWIDANAGGTIVFGERTITSADLMFDFGFMNTKFFGIDLFEGVADNWKSWQTIGIWILAFLVGATQLITQYLSTKRQKKQKDSMNANVPAYRQPTQTDQQKSMETSMKIMMYAMPVTMIIFIIQSPAALGWYWFVGNIYTSLQSYISSKTSAKKLEKLKEKFSR